MKRRRGRFVGPARRNLRRMRRSACAWPTCPKNRSNVLKALGAAYLESMPAAVVADRTQAIENSDTGNIRFAWAGALEPGIGHYYRIQGDTFLIEFVNTQPDAAGNPASHIHCVWRDMRGDFALPIK